MPKWLKEVSSIWWPASKVQWSWFNASLNSLNPESETYEFGVGVTYRRAAFLDLHRVLNLITASATWYDLWMKGWRHHLCCSRELPDSRYNGSKADELSYRSADFEPLWSEVFDSGFCWSMKVSDTYPVFTPCYCKRMHWKAFTMFVNTCESGTLKIMCIGAICGLQSACFNTELL